VFEVLDCHHHVGGVGGALGDDDSAEIPLLAEMAQRLAIMDRDGVAQAVVIPGHGYEHPNGIADTRRVNDGIAAYRDERPDRFPAAVGIVEPTHGKVSLAELDRCKSRLGLAGISFHTRYQGVHLDHPWVLRYVEHMVGIGLVPFLHAFPDSVEEALWKVARIGSAHPGAPMLVIDGFASVESAKQLFDVAERCENLVFDTSLAMLEEQVETFVKRFGADRLVFGTDLYSPPHGRRISHLLPVLLASEELSDKEKELIVGGNARRLLGIGS
jgi:predicted TIM-barrel fold metal-dependent hydrolase